MIVWKTKKTAPQKQDQAAAVKMADGATVERIIDFRNKSQNPNSRMIGRRSETVFRRQTGVDQAGKPVYEKLSKRESEKAEAEYKAQEEARAKELQAEKLRDEQLTSALKQMEELRAYAFPQSLWALDHARFPPPVGSKMPLVAAFDGNTVGWITPPQQIPTFSFRLYVNGDGKVQIDGGYRKTDSGDWGYVDGRTMDYVDGGVAFMVWIHSTATEAGHWDDSSGLAVWFSTTVPASSSTREVVRIGRINGASAIQEHFGNISVIDIGVCPDAGAS